MGTAFWNERTGERGVRKRTRLVWREVRRKGLYQQRLALGLPYFLLGFIGPRKEAEEIKAQLSEFLQNELKLELSEAKTLLTHARTEAARFLGYEITIILEGGKQTVREAEKGLKTKCRNVNSKPGMHVPRDVILDHT